MFGEKVTFMGQMEDRSNHRQCMWN